MGLLLSAAGVWGQARTATCNCPKTVYAETKADASFHLANGKTIVLCGYKNTTTKPVSFSEFVLSVCGQKKIIDFWDAQKVCRLEVNNDTLLLSEMVRLPVGKNFAYQPIVWNIERIYFNGNNILRKAAINRKLPRYNTGEIAGVLTSFESAHGALSEAKLTLADKLFVATISGSSQARKYLMKFKTKFGVLDGDFAEEYKELLTMLLLWDKKGSLQKQ